MGQRREPGDSPVSGCPSPAHTCAAAPPLPVHWLGPPPVRRAPGSRPQPRIVSLSAGAAATAPLCRAPRRRPRGAPPARGRRGAAGHGPWADMRPPSPPPARWLCLLAGALACALRPAVSVPAAGCGAGAAGDRLSAREWGPELRVSPPRSSDCI